MLGNKLKNLASMFFMIYQSPNSCSLYEIVITNKTKYIFVFYRAVPLAYAYVHKAHDIDTCLILAPSPLFF